MSYIGNVPTTAAFPFDQFSGNGSTTAFTLSYAPAGATSIIVSISGVVQNPNTYSISGTTLTFTLAPPTGTNNIAVLYLGLPVVASMIGTMGFIAGSATNPSIYPIGDTNTGIFFPAADTIAFTEGGTEVLRINSTAQIEFTAGSVSTPSITFTGDTNTGIYSPSVDTIAFTEGGTEALRINSSAQVEFTDGTASLPSITNSGNTNTGIFFPAANTVSVGTGGTEALRVDSSQQIGIGETSPAAPLHIKSATNNIMRLQSSDATTGNLYFSFYNSSGTQKGYIGYGNSGDDALQIQNEANSYMTFATNGSERARITSGGDFQFNSGYGSVATAYGCRAWVNFNGTGTVAVRASGNVSSITDNGTGDYTINFSTSMPDANYSLAGITNEGVLGNRSQGWCIRGTDASLVTTSSVRIDVGSQSAGTAADLQVVTFVLFR